MFNRCIKRRIKQRIVVYTKDNTQDGQPPRNSDPPSSTARQVNIEHLLPVLKCTCIIDIYIHNAKLAKD